MNIKLFLRLLRHNPHILHVPPQNCGVHSGGQKIIPRNDNILCIKTPTFHPGGLSPATTYSRIHLDAGMTKIKKTQ